MSEVQLSTAPPPEAFASLWNLIPNKSPTETFWRLIWPIDEDISYSTDALILCITVDTGSLYIAGLWMFAGGLASASVAGRNNAVFISMATVFPPVISIVE